MALKVKGNTTNPGKRRWDEVVDDVTGESSLEVIVPRKVSNWDTCKHFFEYIDRNGNAQCSKCGLGKRTVIGLQLIQDGKIITLHKLSNR